jgi:hypothetical protein
VRCHKPITAGQEYHTWYPRYGPTTGFSIHAEHGYPRRSETTTSKMSGVYSAVEALEDELDSIESVEDLETSLASLIEAVDEVANEYEEAARHFGQQGPSQDAYEALEAFSGELNSVNLPEDLEEAKDEVRSAVESCP